MTQADNVRRHDEGLSAMRRNDIIEAAEKVLAELGVRGMTLKTIAFEIGMSVGHIYKHFRSKEDIIRAIVERHTDELVAMLGNDSFVAATDEATLETRITAFVDSYMRPRTARVFLAIMNEGAHNCTVRAWIRDQIMQIEALIASHYHNVLGDDVPIDPFVGKARIKTFRALLEGLCIAVVYTPDNELEALRKMAVRRMKNAILDDREEDAMLLASVRGDGK